MQTETFDYALPGRISESARPTIWHRIMLRMQTIGVRYELDEHLAHDIGATHYSVPLFHQTNQGGWL